MQSKHENNCSEKTDANIYEYAVVQFVPCIERGEFVNIGLIMMCKRKKWLRIKFKVNDFRIKALKADADTDTLRRQIEGLERVVNRDVTNGGPIAQLEVHERFRWLTAVRSTGLQTSRPHTGLTHDLEDTFSRLFATLVL